MSILQSQFVVNLFREIIGHIRGSKMCLILGLEFAHAGDQNGTHLGDLKWAQFWDQNGTNSGSHFGAKFDPKIGPMQGVQPKPNAAPTIIGKTKLLL